MKDLILVGDLWGLKALLRCVCTERVRCIIYSSTRPQYKEGIELLAIEYGLECIEQPTKSSSLYSIFVSRVSAMKASYLICNSYSLKIPEAVLNSVERAINIHPSLLPLNRGPHPVQWAIIHGQTKTGITAHLMTNDFDAGHIIKQVEVPIDVEDTWVSLQSRIDNATETFLQENMRYFLQDKIEVFKQDENVASKNHKLDSEYPQIDLDEMSDAQIYNLVRAQVKPLAGAYLVTHDGVREVFDSFLSFGEVKSLRQRYLSGDMTRGKVNTGKT